MFKKLLDFFPHQLSPQIKALYASTTIAEFAKGLVAIFEPIYFYTLGFSVTDILRFYIVLFAIYFVTVPLGAKLAKRFGYTKGMMVGSVFLALYFILLILLKSEPGLFIYLALVGALYKSFYWPGHHAEFARYSVHRESGREVSESKLFTSLANAASPFLGGLIIVAFGFPALFVAVTLITFISVIPLLLVPEQFTPTPFFYTDAYHRLFTKKNRHSLLSHLAFGEEFIFAALWPIFLFTIFPNYSDLGGLVTIATVISLVALLVIGEETDHHHKKFLLHVGTALNVMAWFLRVGANLPLTAFAADSLSRVGRNAVHVPWMARTFHLAQHTGVMRTIIFLEMALTLGKLLAALLALGLFWWLPEASAMNAVFLLAAFFTMLYLLFVPNPHELSKLS